MSIFYVSLLGFLWFYGLNHLRERLHGERPREGDHQRAQIQIASIYAI
jgi:hypothetical protein